MKYLVIITDVYNNKEIIPTNRIGDTIRKVAEENDWTYPGDDIKKLNSEDPYDQLPFDIGFYDREFEDKDGEQAGYAMIFKNPIYELTDAYKKMTKMLTKYERTGDEDYYFAMIQPLKDMIEDMERDVKDGIWW